MLKKFKSLLQKHPILILSSLASLVLLFSINFFGLNWDETFSINITKLSFKQIALITINDVHPPLYYYLLKLWIGAFGDSEFMLRMLSLIFYLLAVVVILKIVKRLFTDLKIVSLIAIILTFSGYFIQYANDIRMYSLSLLLISLSFWAYLNLENKKSYRPLFIILIFLATLTHYVAILFFIGLVVYDYLSKGRSVKDLSSIKNGFYLYQSLAAAFLLYVPWIILFVKYRNIEIGSSWVPTIYPVEIIYQPILFLSGLPIPSLPKPPIFLTIFLFIFIISLILFRFRKTFKLSRFLKDKKHPALSTFLIMSFFTYSVNFLTSNRFPAFYSRYLIIATALWFLLSIAELYRTLTKINLLKYLFVLLILIGAAKTFLFPISLEAKKISDCLKKSTPNSIYMIKNSWDYSIYGEYLGLENVYLLFNNRDPLKDHDVWIESKIRSNTFFYLNEKDLEQFRNNNSKKVVLFDDDSQVTACRDKY